MSESTYSPRIKAALEKHAQGYNCAQSVSCVFCDLAGIDEKTMFKITEGLGLGMGGMEGTCGAISAAAVLSGFKCSTCDLESPNSKSSSYQASKKCIQKFKEKNGSVICRELKGIDTRIPLRTCDGCIADAVRIIEENLMDME